MKHAASTLDSFIIANIVAVCIPTIKNFITKTFFLKIGTIDRTNVLQSISFTIITGKYLVIGQSIGDKAIVLLIIIFLTWSSVRIERFRVLRGRRGRAWKRDIVRGGAWKRDIDRGWAWNRCTSVIVRVTFAFEFTFITSIIFKNAAYHFNRLIPARRGEFLGAHRFFAVLIFRTIPIYMI
jgi:hypothetical protein